MWHLAALQLALLLLLPASSFALELSDKLILNGFYTLEASQSVGADSAFPGATSPLLLEDGKTVVDNSLLGLQLDYLATDNLGVTIQGVIGRDDEGEYTPSVEWAYLSYDLGNDYHLRGGLFKPPFLQGTELRYIGYSRLWARPLLPTNATAGFDEYQGAELIKRAIIGDYNLTVQGAYGVAEHRQENIENDNVKVLSTLVGKGESWLKLALFHADFDIYRDDLTTLLLANGEVLMGSAEAEFYLGRSRLNLGFVDSDTDDAPDERMAYLSLGYQMGKLTPYLLYQYHSRVAASLPQLPPPPPPAPPPPPRPGDLERNSYSVGARYDLSNRYAIKAQAERIHTRIDNTPVEESDATVYTVIFEGVF